MWINEPTKVFVARAGVHELTTTILGEEQVRDLVEKLLKSSRRRVDLIAQFVDLSPSARPSSNPHESGRMLLIELTAFSS